MRNARDAICRAKESEKVPINQHPDPEIDRANLMANVNAVMNWGYYDNFQHGTFKNENEVGYGPIKVWNSSVEIMVPRELGKMKQVDFRKYEIIPTEKATEDSYFHFKGDISVKRFDFLVLLSKIFPVEIEVHFEHSFPSCTFVWYEIKGGNAEKKTREPIVKVPETTVRVLNTNTGIVPVPGPEKCEGGLSELFK